jgi:hypothetical protein
VKTPKKLAIQVGKLYERNIGIKPLSQEDSKSFENARKCTLCKKEFSEHVDMLKTIVE